MTDEQLPDQPSLEDLTPLLRINKLCDEFRRAWKEGGPPKIEEYLKEVSEGARESLLRNLLPIDIEGRRRKTKDTPSSDDYIRRFPEHARLIRQTFFESTMASIHHDASTPSVAATVSLIPVAKRLGDYELLRELGKGGFGVVYEARHVKRGDRVALKTLPLDSEARELHSPATEEQKRKTGDRLMRFKREFRMLADMNHPNLVGLHSLEADGDQWFFTMDLIEGTDFIDYVRPGGELDEGRLRAAFSQLVAGVMALHSRNVIHRDLKPSNVMVSIDGRVAILDFGLVSETEKRPDSHSIAGFVGTPAYAAPEQLAGKHSSASDWYSVGTILYESLSGRRPYRGFGIDALYEKQGLEPPPLSDEQDYPRHFAELAMRMLSRNPERRPNALAIAHAASSEVVANRSIEPASSGSLVGRELHLEQLRSSLARVKQSGRTQSAFVTGRSGEGKTSLVEHFLEPLRKNREFIVLAGRCYGNESVPFKAIDGVIDSLCAYLQRMPGEDVALLLPDDIPFLIQLFPVLQRVEVMSRSAKAEIATMDRSQVLHRGFMALRLLLSRISERRTVIVFADDLQWGDSDSAEGVLKIASGTDSPALLFIGTYRSDEVAESPFVSRWNELQPSNTVSAIPMEQIGLAPLDASECTQLMIDRLGRDDELIRQRSVEFQAKTGGNPYLLIELIGCFDPDTDSFEALALRDVIDRKLSRLPGEALSFLAALSVSGRAATPREIFLAAGQKESSASLITQMRNENLLRLAGADEAALVDTYHDKIRETVLDEMDAAALTSTHHAMAQAIESVEGIDPGDVMRSIMTNDDTKLPPAAEERAGELARHYEASGYPRQAFCYALLAAEAAVRQFTLHVAVESFEAAQRTLRDAPRAVKYRISVGYGDCLCRLGQSDEALEFLDPAVKLSDDPIEVAHVEYLRGECLFQSNRLIDSVEAFARALELVGVNFPKTRGAILWALTKERFIFLWKARMPRRLSSSPSEMDARLPIIVRSIIQAQKPVSWRDFDQWIFLGLKAANLTYGIEQPSLQTIHFIGRMISGRLFQRLPPFLRDMEKLESELPTSANALLQALARRMAGYIRVSCGEYSAGSDGYRRAEEILTENVQDHYQLISLRWWQSELRLAQGQLDECVDLASKTFDAAVTSGNDRIASTLLSIWTFGTDGKLPFAELSGCFRRIEEDLTSQVYLLAAESVWHLGNGRSESSIVAAENSFRIFMRPRRYYSFPEAMAPAVLARCLNRRADELKEVDEAQSRSMRHQVIKVVRSALHRRRALLSFYYYFPALIRELAVAQQGRGRFQKALKLARQSLEVAEKRGARYEFAQSRVVVAELSKCVNLPDADQLLADAKQGMVEFEQMIEANAAMWERKEEDDPLGSGDVTT